MRFEKDRFFLRPRTEDVEVVLYIHGKGGNAEEAEHFKVLSEQQYVADASMKLDDLNDLLDLTIDSEDYDSIGGKIIELLDHLPEPGETAETEEVTFKVLSADKRRIEKVLITLKEQS